MIETITPTVLVEDAVNDAKPSKSVALGKRFQTLSQVLRGIGAVVLLAAASTFLLQSWQAGSATQRYLTLLGFTAVLSIAAFVCGVGIRDSKAARTLLSLVLAVVPIHFSACSSFVSPPVSRRSRRSREGMRALCWQCPFCFSSAVPTSTIRRACSTAWSC